MTRPERKEMVEEIMEGFQIIRRNLLWQGKERNLKLKITPSQWVVLGLTKRQEANTARDIARTLSMSSSAVTQLVDGLVANGYVVRQTGHKDKRTSFLALSKKSLQRMEKKKKEMFQRLSTLFSSVSAKEFEYYYKLHKKIAKNLMNKSRKA